MKAKLSVVRKIVKEAVTEAKIGASKSYMDKELVREKAQDIVETLVSAGKVTDQKTLDQLFVDMEMSIKSLKMIPIDVWKKLASKKS